MLSLSLDLLLGGVSWTSPIYKNSSYEIKLEFVTLLVCVNSNAKHLENKTWFLETEKRKLVSKLEKFSFFLPFCMPIFNIQGEISEQNSYYFVFSLFRFCH